MAKSRLSKDDRVALLDVQSRIDSIITIASHLDTNELVARLRRINGDLAYLVSNDK